MKVKCYAAIAIALLGLGACASDGGYDAQTHQDINEALDAAIQILNLATQAVTTFAR